MSEGLILKAEGLALSPAGGSAKNPLQLELRGGQCALVLVRDLDYLRRLMRCCLGLDRPEAGAVSWWNGFVPESEENWDSYDFFRRIGYVDRQSQLLGGVRLRDHFILFSRYARQGHVIEDSERLLAFFNLESYLDHKADDLPEPQRRLALYALALCRRPRLLLVERPVQFLDRDFSLVWGLVQNERDENGLACVVFDRGRSAYVSENFDQLVNLEPEA